MLLFSRHFWGWFRNFGSFTCLWDLRVLVEKKLPVASSPATTIRWGIGEFSPTALFQLEKNLQHAPHLVAAGMPLLLGLTSKSLFRWANFQPWHSVSPVFPLVLWWHTFVGNRRPIKVSSVNRVSFHNYEGPSMCKSGLGGNSLICFLSDLLDFVCKRAIHFFVSKRVIHPLKKSESLLLLFCHEWPEQIAKVAL